MVVCSREGMCLSKSPASAFAPSALLDKPIDLFSCHPFHNLANANTKLYLLERPSIPNGIHNAMEVIVAHPRYLDII
jgi:hypothetical protein